MFYTDNFSLETIEYLSERKTAHASTQTTEKKSIKSFVVVHLSSFTIFLRPTHLVHIRGKGEQKHACVYTHSLTHSISAAESRSYI